MRAARTRGWGSRVRLWVSTEKLGKWPPERECLAGRGGDGGECRVAGTEDMSGRGVVTQGLESMSCTGQADSRNLHTGAMGRRWKKQAGG